MRALKPAKSVGVEMWVSGAIMRRFLASPLGRAVNFVLTVAVAFAVLWAADHHAPSWMFWIVFGPVAAAAALMLTGFRPLALVRRIRRRIRALRSPARNSPH